MPIFIPPLTYQQIADAAAKCLGDTHKDGTIPVPIEDIIDVGFGIDLVPTSNLETRFSAVAFITHDLREIRVDDFVFRKQPYRLRFSLAHELGHLILHPNVYKQMAFTTPNQWKQAMTDWAGKL
ncbi:MAG TPA: ImmA/IrrE family metallo-endopeptidase [Tepidisphaeraceae bacterium]|nr:ImmA/IrrE family metallo-endopeptidase [Tepidisphaeraceae bacterium]